MYREPPDPATALDPARALTLKGSVRTTSQFFWRLRRFAQAAKSRAMRRPPPDGARAVIERYSMFGGVLRIEGALAEPVATLALELPGGERVKLQARPTGAGRVGFAQSIAVPGDPAEIAAASLRITRPDGSERLIGGLGEPLNDPAHAVSGRFRTMLEARAPGRMLEVGARARSGLVRRDWAPQGWDYSGFDIAAGPNVDVVGDAHGLSRFYPPGQFDAVMAFSVLEHLLMPWKFVLELNRVLKPGALGLFTTHQCWPLHDEPWDFWRFSDRAWTGLLNEATGFEIVAAAMGEPAYIVAQRCSPATAFAEQPAARLASFVLFRKIGETELQWPVELERITGTSYPV